PRWIDSANEQSIEQWPKFSAGGGLRLSAPDRSFCKTNADVKPIALETVISSTYSRQTSSIGVAAAPPLQTPNEKASSPARSVAAGTRCFRVARRAGFRRDRLSAARIRQSRDVDGARDG